jgi:hypothetical protein
MECKPSGLDGHHKIFRSEGTHIQIPVGDTRQRTNAVRIPTREGETAIQHVETVFPLWFQQKSLLKLLQETRRVRHLQRAFNPGDLVLVRKQVKLSALEGRPEKLTLKAKGPYQTNQTTKNLRRKRTKNRRTTKKNRHKEEEQTKTKTAVTKKKQKNNQEPLGGPERNKIRFEQTRRNERQKTPTKRAIRSNERSKSSESRRKDSNYSKYGTT